MRRQKETVVLEKRHSKDWATTWRKFAILVAAIVCFFSIYVGLPLAEVPDGFSPYSVRTGLALLAFAAMLWLSEALPLAITALLVPVVASLSGTMSVGDSFSGFAHPLIFLFLGGFGLAATLSRQKLDQWIALHILHLGRGKFHPTAIALFMVSATLSMWISNTATVALLLPVALGVIANITERCEKSVSERVAPYLLLGIAYSASIGGIGTLIGSPPNAIAAAELNMKFSAWLRIGIPCVVILLPTLFVLLRIMARPGKVPDFEVTSEAFTFNKPRVATLVVFLLAIAAWLFSAPLSKSLGIEKGFDTLVAISAVILLSSFRLVRWQDIDAATDWGVLMLFGGGITLSRVLGQTGASAYLAGQIQSLTQAWPIALIVGMIVLFVVFLTELSSNTASTALLVPIFAAVAIDMGIPVTRLVLPLTVAASCAFMLPIATPPNAIVYASGHIQQQQMIRIGLVLNISFALILTLLSGLLF